MMPSHRQTLLFSATYPESIEEICNRVLYKPVEVTVEAVHDNSHIQQRCYEVDKNEREQALVQLLSHHQPKSVVIFCTTKRDCQQLADNLYHRGFSALALHGDLEQRARDQVLIRFSNGSTSILVATDVAARGLDIKNLECVVNYELTRDPEVHVHRIGRTGRAGNKGLALNLCTPSEMPRANAIEDYLDIEFSWSNLPTQSSDAKPGYQPDMICLSIDGGRKDKVRPGDILGALTKDAGLPGADIGKIDIGDFHAYLSVHRKSAKAALKHLQNGKIKGRKFKVRRF
jgi:ATP-independent RNA helicase DbpA